MMDCDLAEASRARVVEASSSKHDSFRRCFPCGSPTNHSQWSRLLEGWNGSSTGRGLIAYSAGGGAFEEAGGIRMVCKLQAVYCGYPPSPTYSHPAATHGPFPAQGHNYRLAQVSFFALLGYVTITGAITRNKREHH